MILATRNKVFQSNPTLIELDHLLVLYKKLYDHLVTWYNTSYKMRVASLELLVTRRTLKRTCLYSKVQVQIHE